MADKREALKEGNSYILRLADNGSERAFKIKREIGRGGSCIVYEAEYKPSEASPSKRAILKEYYPADSAAVYYDVTRGENGELLVREGSEAKFNSKKSRFLEGFNFQVDFSNKDSILANASVSPTDIYYGNNTEYILMSRDFGRDFSRADDMSVHEVISAVLKFARIAEEVHNGGYLILDIKPENIFLAANGEVKLFDFDSFKTFDEVRRGQISASVGWCAPEVKNFISCFKNRDISMASEYLAHIDIRSDMYSIGKVLFKKLCGRDCQRREDFGRLNEIDVFMGMDPIFFRELKGFFEKTLSASSFRYSSDKELIEALERLERYSDPKEVYIKTIIETKSDFGGYRDEETAQLHKILEEHGSAFIYGAAGMGKSETAKLYADKYRKEYDIIQFVKYSGSMKNTVLSLSINGLDSEMTKNTEWLFKQICNLLDNCSERVLIVVDNFNTFADIEDLKLLSERRNIKVIFTTRIDIRNRYDGYEGRVLKLEALEEENIIGLFKRFYPSVKDKDMPVIEECIKIIGGNTLVLKVIALQMRKQRTLAENILKALKNAETKTLIGTLDGDRSFYRYLLSTFDISGLDDESRLMLLKMSAVPYLDEKYALKYLNMEDWDRVNELNELGWIERDEALERVWLHEAVSFVVYEQLYNENFQSCENGAAYIVAELVEKGELADYRYIREACDFLKFLEGRIVEEGLGRAEVLNGLGLLYNEMGYPDTALKYIEAAERIVKENYGEENILTAEIYNSLGVVYRKKSDYENSYEVLKKALKINLKFRESCEIEDSLEMNYNNLGIVCCSLGRFDEALEHYKNAKKIIMRTKGLNSAEGIRYFNNAAQAYSGMDDRSKSTYCYEEAMKIAAADKKAYMKYYCGLCCNLGRNYAALERFEEAEKLLLEAERTADEFYGENSETAALCFINQAELYRAVCDFGKAHICLDKAEKIYGNNKEADEHDLARCWGLKGELCYKEWRLDEALRFAELSIEKTKELDGEECRDMPARLNLKCMILISRGRYDEGVECGEKALKIIDKLMPKDKRLRVDIYSNLGLAGAYCKKYAHKSEKYLKEALKLCESVYGRESYSEGIIWLNLGNISYSKADIEKAEYYYGRADEILKEKNIASERAIIYNNFGLIALEKGDFEGAVRSINEAILLSEKILGSENEMETDFYANLAEAYLRREMFEETLENSQKALELRSRFCGEDSVKNINLYAKTVLALEGLERYEEASECCKKIISLYEKKPYDEFCIADYYYSCGVDLYFIDELREAAVYLKKACELYIEYYGCKTDDYGMCCYYLAYTYCEAELYRKAYCNCVEALKVISRAECEADELLEELLSLKEELYKLI